MNVTCPLGARDQVAIADVLPVGGFDREALWIIEPVEQAGKQVGVRVGLLLRIHASFPIGKSGAGSRIISYSSEFH